MSHEIRTLELARIYETQGYIKDAFDIYSYLDSQSSSDEIKAGLNRMRTRLEAQPQDQGNAQKETQLINLIQSLGPDSASDAKPGQDSDIDRDSGRDPQVAISRSFEQWVTLMVMEERINRIKKMKKTSR